MNIIGVPLLIIHVSLIADKFCNEGHYQKSLQIFHGYELGLKLLGKPVKAKWVDLGDKEKSWSDGYNCRVCISNYLIMI